MKNLRNGISVASIGNISNILIAKSSSVNSIGSQYRRRRNNGEMSVGAAWRNGLAASAGNGGSQLNGMSASKWLSRKCRRIERRMAGFICSSIQAENVALVIWL
jgi:hypothetical protein